MAETYCQVCDKPIPQFGLKRYRAITCSRACNQQNSVWRNWNKLARARRAAEPYHNFAVYEGPLRVADHTPTDYKTNWQDLNDGYRPGFYGNPCAYNMWRHEYKSQLKKRFPR